MKQHRSSLGLILGYHGCDKSVADKILGGDDELRESANATDWLGPGIYFWADSPALAFGWACHIARTEPHKIKTPYVLGAYINLGLCLNLTDLGVMKVLAEAYKGLASLSTSSGRPMPQNIKDNKADEYVQRNLDCAVIEYIHASRDMVQDVPYDSVLGVFESGTPAFPGSSVRQRTHIQLAVRAHNNHSNILGYFRVPGMRELIANYEQKRKRERKSSQRSRNT